MVSSLLVDALTNPTVLVSDLYKSRDRTRSFPVQVSKYFSDIFATQDAFNEISVLDLQHPPESFKPHALVRFDSMVQDTSCPPEIYLSQSPKGECGGWGISSPEEGEQDSVDYSLLQECTVVWATSIPGRSRWLDGEASSSDQSAIKSVQSHKYPLPSTAHIGAQVKIYEPQLAESLRTTDLYSFVGVLTSEPRPASLDSTEHVPVPTIHVLFARPIPSTLVPRSFPDQSLLPDLEVAREKLVSWIADEGLSGDRLAAEFVLLSIIHKVQSRSPPLLPLSLTLSGYSHASNPTPKLVDVLSHLVPLCTVLPLSLDAINSTSFFPESKDEDLHSGRLQLPKGSLCMVSELPLNEGTVSERGLLNLKQVQDMINHQTLDYVFPFSRYSFETDINFIVLAAGKRSAFFTTHLQVPVQAAQSRASSEAQSSDSSSTIQLPAPELLNQFRKLVGGAKLANVGLDSSTAAFIQDDFVKERQSAQLNKNAGKGEGIVTSDDLIIRMMVAKALAASLHSGEVTPQIWERAKVLENERQARMG